MRVTEFNFNNIAIRLIDTSSNTERNQRLEEPLKRFFKEIEREKHETKNKGTKHFIDRTTDISSHGERYYK